MLNHTPVENLGGRLRRMDVDARGRRFHFILGEYNDPLYVKIKKLNIKVRLAAEGNADALLSKLKEYASEVVYFVRNSVKAIAQPPVKIASEVVYFVHNSVKAIAQTAVKIDAAAERWVNVLLDLIVMRVRYVVEEEFAVAALARDYTAAHLLVLHCIFVTLAQRSGAQKSAYLSSRSSPATCTSCTYTPPAAHVRPKASKRRVREGLGDLSQVVFRARRIPRKMSSASTLMCFLFTAEQTFASMNLGTHRGPYISAFLKIYYPVISINPAVEFFYATFSTLRRLPGSDVSMMNLHSAAAFFIVTSTLATFSPAVTELSKLTGSLWESGSVI
ncbi:hypothetical protein B0H11DRAFT_1916119 [Mycena galericulata]|nr:hypothetical protein B0H11DRAFT_1916119 [Mycena galericulata]